MLVVASALSVQDVRDRPLEQQQAADQAHAKFDDDKSEFLGHAQALELLEHSRGGHGEHRLRARKHEQLLRENFISPRRVREWRDIHSQLQSVVTNKVARQRQRADLRAAAPVDARGLLGNIGVKSDEDESYLGARGIRFWRHPGARLSKKPGKLDRRRRADRDHPAVRPRHRQDRAPVAPRGRRPLIKTQLLEPHWEKKAAQVAALERATLTAGHVRHQGVDFGKVDPVAAREIFIREALVGGQWETKLPFARANRKLIARSRTSSTARRQDVLVDDELIFAFYDQQVPADV